MQLITTRNKEISFVELKKAISSGNGLELIRPGDKFAIELKNGELVNAVCGGYVNEKRARFVLEDCLAEKWRMNDTPTTRADTSRARGGNTSSRIFSRFSRTSSRRRSSLVSCPRKSTESVTSTRILCGYPPRPTFSARVIGGTRSRTAFNLRFSSTSATA